MLMSVSLFWTASGLGVAHDAEDKLFDIINEGDLVKPARLSIVSVKDRTFTLSEFVAFSSFFFQLSKNTSKSRRTHPLSSATSR